MITRRSLLKRCSAALAAVGLCGIKPSSELVAEEKYAGMAGNCRLFDVTGASSKHDATIARGVPRKGSSYPGLGRVYAISVNRSARNRNLWYVYVHYTGAGGVNGS